jgi:hypothetical protein
MSRLRERGQRGKRGTQREERRAPSPRPAARKQGLSRTLIPLFAILVGGALGMWALMRQRTVPLPPPSISATAMAESMRVAYAEKDWEDALHWARLLVAAESSNPTLVLSLGLAMHNYSLGGSRYGRERSATRTSLERIEMELRSLTLIDSAATEMRSDEQWAEAMSWSGQAYETMGLPLDALQYYTAVRERLPDYPPVLPRVVFVVKSLRDPLTIPSGPLSLTSP